jgi:aminomethyltransferase
MEDRGIPRPGYEVYTERKNVGFVTSGTHSPSLNTGIGLAYVDTPFNKIGQQISIQIRDKDLGAVIIKPPFIKNTTLHH